jgi:hypothetical protein
VPTQLHFAENALALHFLFERLERLVDVIITNEDLHEKASPISCPARLRSELALGHPPGPLAELTHTMTTGRHKSFLPAVLVLAWRIAPARKTAFSAAQSPSSSGEKPADLFDVKKRSGCRSGLVCHVTREPSRDGHVTPHPHLPHHPAAIGRGNVLILGD